MGVRARNVGTGEAIELLATAVVMTTGGFASNVDVIYERCPHLRQHRILEGSHVGARGEGHRMVERAGGATTHMEELWIYVHSIPDYRDRWFSSWGGPLIESTCTTPGARPISLLLHQTGQVLGRIKSMT